MIKVLIPFATLSVLCLVICHFALSLQNLRMFIPNAYYGDGLAYLGTIQGMIERGFWGGVLHVDRLGAPTGALMYDTMVYQQGGLHNLILKLMALVVPNSAFVINVYYILSYPLIAMSTFFFLRQANISTIFSMVGGLLFAFTSYHIFRNTVHIYLSCYYMVPLGGTVLLWLTQGRLQWEVGETFFQVLKKPRLRISILILFLLAVSDAYYTFFTLLALGFQFTVSFFRAEINRWRNCTLVLLLSLSTAAGIMCLVVPTLPEKVAHPNVEKGLYPLARHYYMAEYNSMRLDTVILPAVNHRLSFVASFVDGYRSWILPRGEAAGAPIGIVATVGLLGGILFLLLSPTLGPKKRLPESLRNLLLQFSALNVVLILVGISSGLGLLIAILYPEIRCYIRISLFLQLFSLLIVFSFVDHLMNSISRRKLKFVLTPLVALVLLSVGLYDQTAPVDAYSEKESLSDKSATERKNERYRMDDVFIKKVESILPPGSMVFELPYVSFWTYEGKVGNIEYDHLIPFLHSKNLKWTFGSVVGTPVDLWQRRVVERPVADFLREIGAMGFRAVYVDREGYEDEGASIVAQLEEVLRDEPLVSPDGRKLVFQIPDHGILVEVDPYTYWPKKLQVTNRQLFTPQDLPDYVFDDKLQAALAQHNEDQPSFTGAELETLLNQEMLRHHIVSSASTPIFSENDFKGGMSCPETKIEIKKSDDRPFYTVPITISNNSDTWWNFDATRLRSLTVRSHLLNTKNKMVEFNYPYRLFLGTPLAPHSKRVFRITIGANVIKKIQGLRELQLDVVQDGVAWLSNRNQDKGCFIKIANVEGILGE